MKHRILVVAEDAQVRATLARWLMAAGYAVDLAEGAKRAREVIANEDVDLSIIAPQRLGGAGPDLARELRSSIGRLIVVTEPAADRDAEPAAAIATDGSISKPLNEAEVLVRVKAALPAPAQPKEKTSDTLHFEGHILNIGARQCRTLDGKDIALTRGEFAMLQTLALQAGRVVSRDELRQAVAGRDAGPDDRSVDVLISRLRRKLEEDPKQPRFIATVPGEGYRLADVAQPRDQPQDRQAVVVAEPAAPPVPVGPLVELIISDARPPVRRHRALWLGSIALIGIAALSAALWLSQPGKQDGALPVFGKFDASVVPLINDFARRELQTYPSQPDFKALAISASGYGLSINARDASGAKTEALERCKSRSSGTRYCTLYAVGNDVVWSIKSLQLPLPADIHGEPLDESFSAAELPLMKPGQPDTIAQNYMKNPDHRAFALLPAPNGIGRFYNTFNSPVRNTAVRLAVEGCADLNQAPCLVVSVDGFWTIRVPKSHHIVGLFMLTNETGLAEDDRQRIGAVYGQDDWRAIARGKTGRLYPVAGAPSEAAAVERALNACAEHDGECRIYAISNFLIEDDK